MKGSGCRRHLHQGRSLHLQPHLRSLIQKLTPKQWQLQQRPAPPPHWRASSVCGMAEVSLAWRCHTGATYVPHMCNIWKQRSLPGLYAHVSCTLMPKASYWPACASCLNRGASLEQPRYISNTFLQALTQMAHTPTQGSGSWTRCMAAASSASPAGPAMRDNGTMASITAAAHSPGLMAVGIRWVLRCAQGAELLWSFGGFAAFL